MGGFLPSSSTKNYTPREQQRWAGGTAPHHPRQGDQQALATAATPTQGLGKPSRSPSYSQAVGSRTWQDRGCRRCGRETELASSHLA